MRMSAGRQLRVRGNIKAAEFLLNLEAAKGIWMCRGKGMQVVVMDVEGTDGRERGEDQASIITD